MATSENTTNNFYPGVFRKVYQDSKIVKFEDLKFEEGKTYLQLYETKNNEKCPIKTKEVSVVQIAAVSNMIFAEVFIGTTYISPFESKL